MPQGPVKMQGTRRAVCTLHKMSKELLAALWRGKPKYAILVDGENITSTTNMFIKINLIFQLISLVTMSANETIRHSTKAGTMHTNGTISS